MESVPVVGRRLQVSKELYSAPNGCRVFRVRDVHAEHQPSYALKQVSFDSPEGPRAVVHEAGVFSSLRHDCVIGHVASWTSDVDVSQLDDDARTLGTQRARMLGTNEHSDFNHHGDEIEVPTWARSCARRGRTRSTSSSSSRRSWTTATTTAATAAEVRLLPIRPRSRGARRSLRTFPVRRHSSPALPFQRLTGKTFD